MFFLYSSLPGCRQNLLMIKMNQSTVVCRVVTLSTGISSDFLATKMGVPASAFSRSLAHTFTPWGERASLRSICYPSSFHKHRFQSLTGPLLIWGSSAIRASVCVCVTDVTSTNKPRLREKVVTSSHKYTRTSTAACVEIMRRSDNRWDYYDGLK